jgi:hypothetical protein
MNIKQIQIQIQQTFADGTFFPLFSNIWGTKRGVRWGEGRCQFSFNKMSKQAFFSVHFVFLYTTEKNNKMRIDI